MKIGIGLPNHVAGVHGPLIAEWACRAERRGFDSVTTIDRLVYPSMDSVVALTLAAGAAPRLALVTNVLLAPLYPPAVLAKQLASLAAASGHRLVVGVGVGSRRDDYSAVGLDFGERGRRLEEQVSIMRRAWTGDPLFDGSAVCPGPVRVPLLFGGASSAAVRRAGTIGDGWAAGALRDYAGQAATAERVRAAWQAAGRPGAPQLHASVNFAVGSAGTVETGRGSLARYYGFAPDYAALNVADMVDAAHDARDTVRAYRDMGFDRLLFHPTVASIDQVDRLADAVL